MTPRASSAENQDEAVTLREEGSETPTPEREAASTPQDDNAPADSSAADDKDEKTSAEVLDDVLKASKPETEGSSDSDEPGEDDDSGGEESEQSAKKDGEGDDLPDEVTDEELKSYKPQTRRRVEQLLSERAEYRELGTPDEIKQFKQSHEQFQGLVSYMDDAHLDVDEVNQGFEIMRALKGVNRGEIDPRQALDQLMPYVQTLQTLAGTGGTLPEDLQRDVEQGYITEQKARELASLRSREHLSRQASQAARQEAENLSTQQSQERFANAVGEAVTSWERRWSQSDPDYEAKRSRVQEKLELHFHRRGMPDTVDKVIELADQYRTEVDDEFKRFRPKPREVNPPPPDDGAASRSAREPQNSREVVDMALAGGR